MLDPTWGKGIANGFSCCALTGRADIMELGGIRHAGAEKVFLISTTHGAETTGLAALIAFIDAFEREGMIASNWQRGAGLRRRLDESIVRWGLTAHVEYAATRAYCQSCAAMNLGFPMMPTVLC